MSLSTILSAERTIPFYIDIAVQPFFTHYGIEPQGLVQLNPQEQPPARTFCVIHREGFPGKRSHHYDVYELVTQQGMRCRTLPGPCRTPHFQGEGTVCLRVVLYLGNPKKSIGFLGFPKFQSFPQKGGICFG